MNHIKGLALVICLAFLMASCGKSGTGIHHKDGVKINVVAAIFTVGDMAKEVGKDRVSVSWLLPPGQTPHGFEPSPSQAEALANGDLLIRVGGGLDLWAEKSAKASGNQGLKTLIMAPQAKEVAHCCDHDHEHDASCGADNDPHVWLDPLYVRDFVDKIVASYSAIDPQGASLYEKNGKEFKSALTALHQQYENELKTLKRKEFVTFHSAFGHLCKRYGLTQISLSDPGIDEFGPSRLEKAIDFIKSKKLEVIFVEPQFSTRDVETLARETGAKTDCLDPIGNPLIQNRDSYLNLMKENLKALKRGLCK